MLADVDISKAHVAPDLVRFQEGFRQRFLITIDTEEEFDWQAPLDRHQHRIAAIPALRTFVQFCEGFGIVPVFLVDYPIAVSNEAVMALREAVMSGRAEIGVHMHPWVNPPFDEDVSEFNSFVGNLPEEQERKKFFKLRDEIERNFGIAPRIYRSGRYGVGPNTASILQEGGIAIDSSVRTGFSYGSIGGSDYGDHPHRPYWLDRQAGLVELPLTTGYWGLLRQFGNWLYPRVWRVPRMRGVMARMGLLERIPLTPEGTTVEEAIRGIDIAIDLGLPVLVLSFHSPSLAPGNTPYVQNQNQLDEFYDWWRQVLAYLARRNIAPTCVGEIMASVELTQSHPLLAHS